ncbi:MAG: hypothetical protein CVU03_02450 [Bacteroidetes bacterium HGW-Bacteroidetes-2]|jgi:hypothetical protein|nr:MAG: hypothetical protein CVU13_05865 [Bacteroidetes bacterium HGW-Bacteroidetes-8]PKP26755.1 MAG: hypothetical protein CVU03_02450 [Bacteroidetes bacterium HGW-Bacteroidetes-2]
MKTKVLKFGMPLMAFLLAIVFAFATSPEAVVEESASFTGYILQNGKCVEVRTCNNAGGPLCMYNGAPVRTKISDTQCGSFLTHWVN